ncbi:Lrp/AsnC family transcriptional regulator [Bacillus sp. es.036]|uniref:Lrp/AsnC family transcriptional regulator n=1 Tax=Bacillus sp. es.036 TaxID=1761764 RepID=UPI000BF5DE78|nr:Lrp/AsnC family transcriptional regulator [Bacillus sp. es.036]PFG12007.1 Lrp/AsnC family leucine-responsive transcriptional regulator [Bacillus sp. es.036]
MIDQTDLRIIKELTKNGRITMKELGEKVHLTGQAASSRVLRLEEEGIIEGYSIKVDKSKMGYAVHCFLTIYTRNIPHTTYLSYIKTKEEYVLKNYKISGDGCYLLECRFPSNKELDEFLVQLNEHVNYKLSIVINEAAASLDNLQIKWKH